MLLRVGEGEETDGFLFLGEGLRGTALRMAVLTGDLASVDRRSTLFGTADSSSSESDELEDDELLDEALLDDEELLLWRRLKLRKFLLDFEGDELVWPLLFSFSG